LGDSSNHSGSDGRRVSRSSSEGSLGNLLNGATVLVTGGAGFIGSALAIELCREATGARIVAFDSLRRFGSELNVARLRSAGVEFVHGDVRVPGDLESPVDNLKLIIDCAADPSVLAGYVSPPNRLVSSNLIGTVNSLELARRTGADFIFMSTSRVYPIAALNQISTVEQETRFEIDASRLELGVSMAGVSERFPLDGVRSLYGATKLASELLLREYAAMYGFRFVINRLGVVTGPGQMGTVEQGVFSLWMARHFFGGDLTYRGWGGGGKQVRDLLHVQDVCRLVLRQVTQWDRINGRNYNVGGGASNSLSLCEATRLCRELTGRQISVRSDPATHPADVRLYYTDSALVTHDTGWMPTWDTRAIFADLLTWFRSDEQTVRRVFSS
jgi:CDP-paratose 2-epimerase